MGQPTGTGVHAEMALTDISIADVRDQTTHQLAYSPGDAARILGVGRTKLYELLDSGDLRSSKIGKRRLITLDAIRECLTAYEVRHD